MTYPYFGPTRDRHEAMMRSENQTNLRDAARAAQSTQEDIEQLVRAMETQLELARAAQKSAESSEKFTRLMSWASLTIAVGSLVVAIIAALVTAVI